MRYVLVAVVLACGCWTPQLRYPCGSTGVNCPKQCYSGNTCDTSLLPAAQVDSAIRLVAAAAVENEVRTPPQAGEIAAHLYICIVQTRGLQFCRGSCWANGDCTTLDQPGSCMAGQQAFANVVVTIRDPQGNQLKVWQTALVHELLHAFGVPDGDPLLSKLEIEINGVLQLRYP